MRDLLDTMTKKFRSPIDTSALLARLEQTRVDADDAATRARATYLSAFDSGDDVVIARARKALADADRTVAAAQAALRGMEERQRAIAAATEKREHAEAEAAWRKSLAAAKVLADKTDDLAERLYKNLTEFVQVRADLIGNRGELATIVERDLGGVPDYDGTALRVHNIDAFCHADLGAMGLPQSWGPKWTSPDIARPPTIAERIKTGSAHLLSILAERAPR